MFVFGDVGRHWIWLTINYTPYMLLSILRVGGYILHTHGYLHRSPHITVLTAV
jgi:hypothetical protein